MKKKFELQRFSTKDFKMKQVVTFMYNLEKKFLFSMFNVRKLYHKLSFCKSKI